MPELRALSIRQPWAWAIATQEKDVENRSWQTHYRGLIAVHASRRLDEDAVIPAPAAAEALQVLRAEVTLAHRLTPSAEHMRLGRIVAVAEITGCHEDGECEREWGFCSPWAQRFQWHWQLSGVRPLAEPVPCKGALGLWRVPDDIESAIRAQLEASRA